MSEAPAAIQAHFLAALPRIETHARTKFRALTPEAKEEAVQAVLGLAWKAYLGEVEKGKDPDTYISAIADFSVRQVRDGRDVTGTQRANDVLSARAQRRRGFVVQAFPERDSTQDQNEALDALIDRRSPAPDKAAEFRLDYPAWLARFKPVKRAILVDAAMGEGTQEMARVYALSEGRISQIRKEAFEDWRTFHAPKEPEQAPEGERSR